MTGSDYLDTSNPYRLLAFFQFCDVANMARKGIAELQLEPPEARRCIVSVISSMRERSIAEAFALLNGGEFKAIGFK